MERFKINENVIVDGGSYTGVVVGIDAISYPLPLYEVKINETGEVLPYYEPTIKKLVTPDEALRYGEVLRDDEFEYEILDYTSCQISETNYHRIRTIRYDNRIFYHKMINGEVVKFKELTV